MDLPSGSKLTWKKSDIYYLKEDLTNGVTYILRKGEVTETEIIYFNQKEKDVKKSIYKNKDTILFDLLNIDESNPESIIEFCNKYGRLGIAYLCSYDAKYSRENFHNDYFSDFPDAVPDFTDDGRDHIYKAPETVKSYQMFIQVIRAIVTLQDAIQNKNYVKIFDRVLFLLSTFEGFTDSQYSVYFKINNEVMNGCKNNILLPEYTGDLFDPDNPKSFADYEPWVTGKLIYKDGFSLEEYVKQRSQTELESVLYYGQCLTARIINTNIKLIRLYLEATSSGKLEDAILAGSLEAIVYYELFLKISKNNIIRRCRNRKCNDYFQIEGNDTRKKYCSPRCATNEAKRMERERKNEAK